MVSELEIKPVNRFASLQKLVLCGGSFPYRFVRNLRASLFLLGPGIYFLWCRIFGFEGIVIHLFHGTMEIDVLKLLLDSAAFIYVFLKLHRIDKKVDVLETRIDLVIDGEYKSAKKRK